MKTITSASLFAAGILAAMGISGCCGARADEGVKPPPGVPAPATATAQPAHGDPADPLHIAGEKHLRRIRQLTAGGSNAEAYLSRDDRRLTFQSTRAPFECDQIFTMNLDGSDVRLVSSGKGRTTCSWWLPDGSGLIYASTHAASPDCPPRPDRSKGYVWAIYDTFDIYACKPDGSDLRRLTDSPGYDAEGTIADDGSKIAFTSMRDGDLDIYTMNLDGSGVTRLTDDLGYDGGPTFSFDSQKIVYRAYHPQTDAEKADYKDLLAKGLIRPTTLEIFVMNADGSGKRQVTGLHAASFGPAFSADGKRIIFSSNVGDPSGRNFELYTIGVDGAGLERVTSGGRFDGFPMFTRDGKTLVWASNRNGKEPRETNVFVADWVE